MNKTLHLRKNEQLLQMCQKCIIEFQGLISNSQMFIDVHSIVITFLPVVQTNHIVHCFCCTSSQAQYSCMFIKKTSCFPVGPRETYTDGVSRKPSKIKHYIIFMQLNTGFQFAEKAGSDKVIAVRQNNYVINIIE